MQLSRKDHICIAIQKKIDLAFTFTAEQNPAITAIIIVENHKVKGQHLITSWWSRPTFEKEPRSSIPLTLGGVK